MVQFTPTAQCIEQDDTCIRLTARIGAELQAFQGHFPEFAVFPGVAQIAIVKDIIAQYYANLGQICRIEQLRFQSFILPEQDIFILIERSEDHVSFKLTNAIHDVVASGRLFLKNNDKDNLMSIADLPKQAEYYLPHRAPMLLLDELVETKENGCVAKVTIREDMPFMEQGGLPSWVGIEIMAQTIAMYGGIQERLKEQTPKLGFLLGSKKFEMAQDYFAVGEELIVEIKLQFLNRHQIGIFECSINTPNGHTTATILVSQPDDPAAIIALSQAS